MQKNNNYKTKRHHGNSPHFQEIEQGLHEIDIGFKSMNQHPDESPYIQLLEQQLGQEEDSDEQEFDTRQRKGMRTRQGSFDETEFRRNQDEENLWQDDGGDSG
jgi:hypothetical protein